MALEPLSYDETTGLPTLPEGFAWEVTPNSYAKYEDDPDKHALTVMIAQRVVGETTWFGRLFGAEPTVEWLTYSHDFEEDSANCPNSREDLKEAATKIYNTVRDRQLAKEKLSELVGLYPPKSIL